MNKSNTVASKVAALSVAVMGAPAFAEGGATDPFAAVDFTQIIAGVALVGGSMVTIALAKKGWQMAAKLIGGVK